MTNAKLFLVALALAAFSGVAVSNTKAAAAAASASVTFSAQQTVAGQKAYGQSCAQCHGAALQGGAGPALTGASFQAQTSSTTPTVGALFTYITKNMPLTAPGSLSHDQYVSILAFVLSKNGYKAGGAPLTFQSATSSTAKVIKGS